MKKSVFMVVFLSLFFTSVPWIAAASDLFGTIWFRDRALVNAEVKVQGAKEYGPTRTNQLGYYSIRNIEEPGQYRLIIKFENNIRNVDVYVYPQNTEKNIQLN
jgi:plasmid maintenance system killer protein